MGRHQDDRHARYKLCQQSVLQRSRFILAYNSDLKPFRTSHITTIMGNTTSNPADVRLEQAPGLEEIDPSLIEHERLRERSFSVRRSSQRGLADGTRTEKGRKSGKWDEFVTEASRRVLNFTPSWFSVK